MDNFDHYVRIHYTINGKNDWMCINKKFKDKPASLSITADDSKEAYMEMQNARKADFFSMRNKFLRNKYLRTKYSSTI